MSSTVKGRGRVIGRNGLATRKRLLDALAHLLAESSDYRVTPVDVARKADMSPAAFYQYFASMEEAMKELSVVLAASVEEAMTEALSEAVKNAPEGEHWAAVFAFQFAAVVSAFEDVCVASLPVLSAVASQAVGKSNSFSDALAQIRDSLVRALLDVAGYNGFAHSPDLLDEEASALLMFYLLPLGADQNTVVDDLRNRASDIAREMHVTEEVRGR